MLQKLNVWGLVTLLFVIQTNGFSLPDFGSFEELDSFGWDTDASIDETDYWNLIDDFHEQNLHHELDSEEQKWNEIDNLELDIDDTEPEYMTQFSNKRGSLNYFIGKRVRGDSVVAYNKKNQTWHRSQNVKANLTYPSNRAGKRLTYIEIQVNQTNNLGQAYVVRGGIGQRFISIIVEAYNTLYFNYTAKFYGL